MNLNLHLKIVGLMLILLALAHVDFPRRLGWRVDLAKVSLFTRQVFYVHCFFLCLVLALCGALSLFGTAALMERTPLARMVLGGLVIFWGARLFAQFFVYDSKLWRGNAFNTGMHVLFSLMWIYFVAVYGAALWDQFGN